VRTTLELPEPLFHRAKMAAVQRRITLRQLIASALERELMGPPPTPARMVRPPIGLDCVPTTMALTHAEMGALFEAEDLAESGH
jgi:hypothetical protein